MIIAIIPWNNHLPIFLSRLLEAYICVCPMISLYSFTFILRYLSRSFYHSQTNPHKHSSGSHMLHLYPQWLPDWIGPHKLSENLSIWVCLSHEGLHATFPPNMKELHSRSYLWRYCHLSNPLNESSQSYRLLAGTYPSHKHNPLQIHPYKCTF